MDIDVKTIVNEAFTRLLRLVVKLALRNGLTYQELTAISKRMFVDVAAKEYGIQGRQTNVSRIALLTGLDRKEVKRIKELLNEHDVDNFFSRKQDRFSRVISAWCQDPEFVTPSGKPSLLMRQGGSKSFSSLAKRFGGDIPEVALLKELIRVGVAQEMPSGRVKLIKRNYIPDSSSPDALMRAVGVLQDIGQSIFHNLYESDSEKNPPRFERRAHNNFIDRKSLNAFRELVNTEGQAFLERVDAWLTEHEADPNDEKAIRLGVGAYLIFGEEEAERGIADGEKSN